MPVLREHTASHWIAAIASVGAILAASEGLIRKGRQCVQMGCTRSFGIVEVCRPSECLGE